ALFTRVLGAGRAAPRHPIRNRLRAQIADQNYYAATLFLHGAHRLLDNSAARGVAADTEHVTEHVNSMHAHAYRAALDEVAFDEGPMLAGLGSRLVDIEIEGTGNRRRDGSLRHALDDPIVLQPIGDQVLNGADLEAM